MNFYTSARSLILPLKEIDANLPKRGMIIELGCGEGVISSHIAQNKNRVVIGIDKNRSRLKRSTQSNLKFKYGDITKFKLNKSDGIVISDVLHHLNIQDQRRLIKKISQSLRKKGRFIIKEIDKSEFFRSKLSRIWDYALYPKDQIEYWNSDDLCSLLKESDFKVKVSRPCRLFPGSTTLYVCTK